MKQKQKEFRKILLAITSLCFIIVGGMAFGTNEDLQFHAVYASVSIPEKPEILKEEAKGKFVVRNKVGHRYLSLSEKEWVLNETDKAGFKRIDIECLIDHESSWDEEGELVNYSKSIGYSIDRGLFAINDYWHSEVSNNCAYDYQCNTKEFIRIATKNGNFNSWIGYVNNCK